jgi:hypothetical protein
MLGMKCVAAVSAFWLALWAGPCAFATSVTAEQGQVLLNTGQGYRLVQGSTNVNPGDMIVVNPGGLARIIYDDGCVREVRPPAVTAISSQSPLNTSGCAKIAVKRLKYLKDCAKRLKFTLLRTRLGLQKERGTRRIGSVR